MTTDTERIAALEKRVAELDAKHAAYRQAGYRPVWGRAGDVRRTTLNRVGEKEAKDERA